MSSRSLLNEAVLILQGVSWKLGERLEERESNDIEGARDNGGRSVTDGGEVDMLRR